MNTNTKKLLYQIALTQIEGVGDVLARNLLETLGDEETIFKSSKKDLIVTKGISANLADRILNADVLRKAEKELQFIEKNRIKVFFYSDPEYPTRLKECIDAPILLYYKGNHNLDTKKIISIVGTRKATSYGSDFCDHFLEQLSIDHPDTLVISGLAYGIDICAHRSALKWNLPTVGVLAHGLDRIYPQSHRKTAIEMIENGGLLTEFPSGTSPDKFNFVRRNRIVAGIADAVIVVESSDKGGSLITAELANSYNKDVFALPGRITDQQSKGCNKLIEQNKAIIFESVESFIKQMDWDFETSQARNKPKQQKLFLDLTPEEQLVYDVLQQKGNLHINLLATEVEIPVFGLQTILLTMEMNNIIRACAGNTYELN